MNKVPFKAQPALQSTHGAQYQLQGFIQQRLHNNLEHWLLCAPEANPAMLQMFRDRDRSPRRDLVPWAGEFAGKYLTSAVLALRLSPDERLRAYIGAFVRDLIATQDEDGYLGPAPRNQRLTGKTLAGDALWDIWGHYHCLLGLLLWYEDTADPAALAACTKAADLLCRRFLYGGEKVISAGAEEMNQSITHVLCLLYEQTGKQEYLRLAHAVEQEWQIPPAGDYVRTALAGLEYYQTPKPRWESLHDILAIAELYYITGDAQYRRAYEHIWRSIVRGDRHNGGGFTSGEAAVGNPYDGRAIETCCSVAWVALSIDMLRLTGDSRVADEIELSTFNAILGAQHPSGRWWTYNTPMDGLRKASAHEIVFQAREGAPELNCCSVNGPRGIAMLSEWAVMQNEAGVTLNYYGPASMRVPLPSGAWLTLTQETRYPQEGQVNLKLGVDKPQRFALSLRIPAWSADTRVAVNGEELPPILAGKYLTLEREWKPNDQITLWLDMTPHVWVGEREAAGKVSIYCGPLLMVYDRQYNTMDPAEIPALSARNIQRMQVNIPGDEGRTWLQAVVDCEGAQELILVDFASAGAAGTPYHSWLPALDLQRGNPADYRVSPFAV
jgi:DUF1680 family protein